MNTGIKSFNEFIMKHSRLSIIAVYNIVTIIVALIFYPILPILMGYPPNAIKVLKHVGTSYGLQYVIVIGITIAAGTICLIIGLKGINEWSLYSDKSEVDIDKLRNIRKKCINLPYFIYIFQLLFINIPLILVAFLVSLIAKAPLLMILKVFILLFSMNSLMAIISHIFSKKIFSAILLKTYTEEKLEGIRISLRAKIFLQIIPMFIVALLFTSVLGYSRLMEEKGDLVYLICQQLLNNNKNIEQATNADQIFNSFNKSKIQNVKISYFIISNGKFISSEGYKPTAVFNYYVNNPIGVEHNKVYGDTNEVQGVITKINGKMGEIRVGIKYELASSKTATFFLISLCSLLTVLIFILYYVSRTFIKEITLLSKSLTEIAQVEDVNSQIEIPVTSNDEVGDLVIAFNKISIRQHEFNKVKNEFITNISHELKTPLNVIFASAQLFELYMKNGLISDKEKTGINIKIIKQNCRRLLRLINNFIDITKIDTGFIQLHLKPLNIVKLIEMITLSVTEYAKTKGIRLHFETELPKMVMYCDPDKIERIILNLLSNSIKFTNSNGDIYVAIRESEKNLFISVKDSGIGIPKNMQEIIFERFKQVAQSLSRNHWGSGIGLALVKSFVEMHEGIIYVNSTEGIGSEFTIKLPIRVPEGNEYRTTDYHQDMNEFENEERINIEFSDTYTVD